MTGVGTLVGDVMRLAQLEFATIHALCDRADVPREANDERLSAAQRVLILEQSWRGLVCSYRGVPPPVAQ